MKRNPKGKAAKIAAHRAERRKAKASEVFDCEDCYTDGGFCAFRCGCPDCILERWFGLDPARTMHSEASARYGTQSECLTVRVVQNVTYHIGAERTPRLEKAG